MTAVVRNAKSSPVTTIVGWLLAVQGALPQIIGAVNDKGLLSTTDFWHQLIAWTIVGILGTALTDPKKG